MAKKGEFKLQVPLDASGIKNFKPDRGVKVVAFGPKGASQEHVVKLDPAGKGSASFSFGERPESLRVSVGPEDASAADLKYLQTISVDVSSQRWRGQAELTLPAVSISAFYWWWWHWWCRDYTITGRLVCADGSPVPGATVCAYDVDWWWWWSSEQQVGCAVTDANGTFQISFRRCCGWYWWWWWELRTWRVDPGLADRIVPLLQEIPGIRRIPLPDPAPDLKVFQALLGQSPGAGRSLALAAPAQRRRKTAGVSVDPGTLETLRSQLMAKLPHSPELERLCVWPWCPWWPWWDCDADIIFRATQNCNGQNKVIVDETIFQTRFDIPAQLNVNLVANDQACCLHQCQDSDCPEGNCILPIDICDTPSSSVGGNPGANPAPATIGYENPGLAAPGNYFADRPFSENVLLQATMGAGFDGDYYEFEWTTTPSVPASWAPMPLVADGAFYRYYWDAMLNQHAVLFSPTPPINSPDGPRNVFESRQHYEANNSIGIGWDECISCNYPTLMVWQTNNTGFANGTYYLRLKAWTRPGYAGDLANKRIVPFCGDNPVDNYVVITIDNRPAPGPGAGHPVDHPCGPGTVHVCTTQPDSNIFAVKINGQPVNPCGKVTATDDQPVEIDFMVHDSDDMLAFYSLSVNWGLNQTEDLIDSNGVHIGTLTAGPAASFASSWIGPAAQVGPDYGTALTQGAAAPNWEGGTLTLKTTVGALFPETCCYQLQLWAFKRNIVNCYYGIDSNGYYNLTEFSFTVFKS
jgi:hypothetical protein